MTTDAMTTPKPVTQQIKLVVIATDFAAAYHIGAGVETTARVFDMPPGAAEWIAQMRVGGNCNITLAMQLEQKP
jgi:hypothetical protein